MNEILALRRTSPSAGLSTNLTPEEEEATRLQTLKAYEILDSAAEKSYDDIARLTAYICGAQIAMISFIDRDRQWIKSRFSSGIFSEKTQDLPRTPMFCDTAIQHHDGVFFVPDMTADPGFAEHALITGLAKLRFYAAAPLVAPTGAVLGTLSVMDRKTRTLSQDQVRALEILARQVLELLELRRTVIGLSEANARLGQQNFSDALTGIPNRRAYDQKLSEEFARSKRTGAALSLLMIDIDLFKDYNDTFGHPAGDTALQSVARALQATLRPYDFLARYGGEEFAVILPATELSHATLVAERVRLLVASSDFPHRKFTISIGVATLVGNGDVKALVQAAGAALQCAKSGGRNKVMAGSLEDAAPAQ